MCGLFFSAYVLHTFCIRSAYAVRGILRAGTSAVVARPPLFRYICGIMEEFIDIRRIPRGQKIETTVAGISGGTIFLDLNAKTEGILDAAEFTGEDGVLHLSEGDRVTVYFLGDTPDGPRFTTRLAADNAGAQELENAWQNRIPVNGTVEKEIKGGFEIRIGKTRAFCPYSQSGIRGKSFAAGQTVPFLITEFRDGGRHLVVSHRILLEEEEKKRREELQSRLHEGMTVKGTVSSIHPFGVFVDIGGLEALIPVSEIARKRISGPEEIRGILPEGTETEAVILRIDPAHGRIALSRKALERDPWQGAAERYRPGSRVSGCISRTADFGVFVTLEEGVDGLVHVSELEKAGLVSAGTNLRKAFCPGGRFDAEVLAVDGPGRRISLKPAENREEAAAAENYLGSGTGGDTYSPFAALLDKNKAKKS